MKWIGVLLNSNHDGLDGRYSPVKETYVNAQGDVRFLVEDNGDFAEDFDQYDVEPLPDLELEGD